MPKLCRYDFDWLSATGTGCFFASLFSGVASRAGTGSVHESFLAHPHVVCVGPWSRSPSCWGSGLCDPILGLGHRCWALHSRAPVGSIHSSGLSRSLCERIHPTCALTVRDASSTALFGSLQRITSQQLGIDPVLMCAANSAGSVMGKMVDARSMATAPPQPAPSKWAMRGVDVVSGCDMALYGSGCHRRNYRDAVRLCFSRRSTAWANVCEVRMLRFSDLAWRAQVLWRRERSNPRYPLRYTRFRGARLQPLGHLSLELKLL